LILFWRALSKGAENNSQRPIPIKIGEIQIRMQMQQTIFLVSSKKKHFLFESNEAKFLLQKKKLSREFF